ncbi:MAG: DNA-processing protein DprA [Thermodesulfobacteriota bacterium]|nr:DNA-processing protein DprA [Thermodesulfobacteriota bacterium]
MEHIEAWIALSLIPNIGPVSIMKLLEVFQTPEDILNAGISRIRSSGILNKAQLSGFESNACKDDASKILEQLEDMGAHAIGLDNPAYPSSLREISAPPVVLYVRGDLDDIEPSIAMVGTRAPSFYGRQRAQEISRELSSNGITIVSGLARGIDTASHQGALEGISKTVAVLGCGPDIIYPAENAELFHKIIEKGAVVTEFPPGTSPEAGNFPRRNRIISGLSSGVMVIEATIKSGAMITARLAAEQGRMVMALPGSTTNIRSRGPHYLIRQGSTLVENASQVIEECAPQIKNILQSGASDDRTHDKIIDIMSGETMNIEEIALALGVDIKEAATKVSKLELEGKIVRLKGRRFTTRGAHV